MNKKFIRAYCGNRRVYIKLNISRDVLKKFKEDRSVASARTNKNEKHARRDSNAKKDERRQHRAGQIKFYNSLLFESIPSFLIRSFRLPLFPNELNGKHSSDLQTIRILHKLNFML